MDGGGGGGRSPVKSGVIDGAGGVKVMALIVLLSCLLYIGLTGSKLTEGGDTRAVAGGGSFLTGVRLNTIPSDPEAGVRSNVARGSAVNEVLRAS